MNWIEFFKTGAITQINATHYCIMSGPFTWSRNAASQSSVCFQNDFYLNDKAPWGFPAQTAIVSRTELERICAEHDGAESYQAEEVSGVCSSDFQWQPADFEFFQRSFTQIQESIAKGEIEKAVPVVRERSQQKPVVVDLIKKAIQAPEHLWAYGVWDSFSGMFGLTPEILFSKKQNCLETYALAGTRPRDAEERMPLLQDAKEMKEHGLVVESLKNQLSSFGEVWVGETQVVSLPTLEHLKTLVQVKLKNEVDFDNLVLALHPTPALGAWPCEKGLSYLAELEGDKKWRARFGAPFGLRLAEGEELCLVSIRNIQWDEDGSSIFSGCGVVAESELDREWAELSLKRQAVKNLLGLQ